MANIYYDDESNAGAPSPPPHFAAEEEKYKVTSQGSGHELRNGTEEGGGTPLHEINLHTQTFRLPDLVTRRRVSFGTGAAPASEA